MVSSPFCIQLIACQLSWKIRLSVIWLLASSCVLSGPMDNFNVCAFSSLSDLSYSFNDCILFTQLFLSLLRCHLGRRRTMARRVSIQSNRPVCTAGGIAATKQVAQMGDRTLIPLATPPAAPPHSAPPARAPLLGLADARRPYTRPPPRASAAPPPSPCRACAPAPRLCDKTLRTCPHPTKLLLSSQYLVFSFM